MSWASLHSRHSRLVEGPPHHSRSCLKFFNTNQLFCLAKVFSSPPKRGIHNELILNHFLTRSATTLFCHPATTLFCHPAATLLLLCPLLTVTYNNELEISARPLPAALLCEGQKLHTVIISLFLMAKQLDLNHRDFSACWKCSVTHNKCLCPQRGLLSSPLCIVLILADQQAYPISHVIHDLLDF